MWAWIFKRFRARDARRLRHHRQRARGRLWADPAWRPRPREHVGEAHSRSAKVSSSCPRRSLAAFVETAREGCVGARVILCHDGLVRDAKGEAEVVDYGGHQRAPNDATGDEGRGRNPNCHAVTQPRRK